MLYAPSDSSSSLGIAAPERFGVLTFFFSVVVPFFEIVFLVVFLNSHLWQV